jgi:hypothetical protein
VPESELPPVDEAHSGGGSGWKQGPAVGATSVAESATDDEPVLEPVSLPVVPGGRPVLAHSGGGGFWW